MSEQAFLEINRHQDYLLRLRQHEYTLRTRQEQLLREYSFVMQELAKIATRLRYCKDEQREIEHEIKYLSSEPQLRCNPLP